MGQFRDKNSLKIVGASRWALTTIPRRSSNSSREEGSMALQIKKLQTRGRCINNTSLHDKISNLRQLILSAAVFAGQLRDIISLQESRPVHNPWLHPAPSLFRPCLINLAEAPHQQTAPIPRKVIYTPWGYCPFLALLLITAQGYNTLLYNLMLINCEGVLTSSERLYIYSSWV
jgi:hypothetical protein